VFSNIAVQTTSIAHLGVDRFGSLKVWWPPLPEQTRIVSIVQCWDRAIAIREKQLELVSKVDDWLNQQLLSGARRFPVCGSSPWRDVTLGQITNESTLRNSAGLDAKAVRAVNKTLGMIPMRERTIGANLSRYKLVRRDWFAYNPMRLNIGSLSRWEGAADVLVSPDYVVFQCDTTQLIPDYFDHLRRSRLWDQFVNVSGNGSVRVRIYYQDIARLKLKLPCLQEQRKIADVLNASERELCILRKQIALLRKQKEGLVGRLVCGPPNEKGAAA
jgi:type I restriction enzyme S subunit